MESLVADLIERLALPCEACMADARISASELNSVLLVGGMTRMPRVQSRVEEIFHQPPNRDVNPDEVVAVGSSNPGICIERERSKTSSWSTSLL